MALRLAAGAASVVVAALLAVTSAGRLAALHRLAPAPPAPPVRLVALKLQRGRGFERIQRRWRIGDRALSEDIQIIDKSSTGWPVALTFDDGPHPTWTPRILAVLKRYKAKATFFIVGSMAKRWSKTLVQVIRAGHEIGIHSWSHMAYTRLSPAAMRADINRCLALLRRFGVTEVRCFRPPYGAVNARVKAVVESAGLRIAMWDVDTSDYQRPPASVIAARILAGARPGAIVLLHDGGGDRSRTVAALAMALPKLRSRGARFVTLSELWGIAKPPPQVVIAEAGRSHKARLIGACVWIDGQPVLPMPSALQVGRFFLLEAGPVLRKLTSSKCWWDPNRLRVVASGPAGDCCLWVGSRLVTGPGWHEILPLPAVRWRGRVFALPEALAALAAAGLVAEPDGEIHFLTGRLPVAAPLPAAAE